VSLTAAALLAIMPNARRVAAVYAEVLGRAMPTHDIDTPERQAAFLAQIAHESGQLQYTRELWGPTPAQSRYEGRADLGNTQAGDGKQYLGRGLIQITGRANYARTSQALFTDQRLLDSPALLETPELAAYSAAWWWQDRGLNPLADRGAFRTITRRINGGLNGVQDREAYWARAKRVFGVIA